MILNGEFVKGSIYYDKSTKSGGKRHNCLRADVIYYGKVYRKRAKDRQTLVNFLLEMKKMFAETYYSICDCCGKTFEHVCANQRFCSSYCRTKLYNKNKRI